MKIILIYSLVIFSLSGCLKTAEQVRKEQRIENMSQQLSDSQNIVADLTVMLKNLQTQIDTLNGRVDELQQGQKNNKTSINESLTLMKQQLDLLQATQTTQTEELKQQRGFIEKVTEKLSKVGASSAPSKKNSKEEIAVARKLIQKRKFSDARAILDELVNDSSVGAGDLNKVYFGLGEIEFGQKNWEKSLVFFSKIYTKYPKSSLAPASLLHIGKALNQMGKKDESQQAFQELKTSYPDSSAAKEIK
ncbi:MAG: tetratricopeptide repeat protein [Bacteriovoracaceae bacterium]|nr:tetratricopeptide repeat protein [Bacteriovoracaceae bacterium]